ncbi:MAG: sulfotransferase domain-containing protein [Dissulfurispiraceae bacterium]
MSDFLSGEDVTTVITIVSGLPRSGTSLMMRILEAGGMSVIVDNIREADEDNPGGYYEYEKVKELEQDNSWMGAARGKAIKIVSPLLYYVPQNEGYNYKIVFMRRDLDEIVASQRKMAERLQQQNSFLDSELKATYIEHLRALEKWLCQKDCLETLHVDYTEVVFNTRATVSHIKNFLKQDLNIARMAETVDDSLYRQQRERSVDDFSLETAADNNIIEMQLKQLGYL